MIILITDIFPGKKRYGMLQRNMIRNMIRTACDDIEPPWFSIASSRRLSKRLGLRLSPYIAIDNSVIERYEKKQKNKPWHTALMMSPY